MKRFVIGDIHGRADALKEVLAKCGFDHNNDRLIILGDVVDGGEDVMGVVDELLKIKDCVFVRGNHDEWFIEYFLNGFDDEIWLKQGGAETIRSYGGTIKNMRITSPARIPESHKRFFTDSRLYYIEDKNTLFVHGGILPGIPLEKQDKETFLWDRSLRNFARKNAIPGWKRIFVGHSPTEMLGAMEPITLHNLIMVDTGAGWSGKLTIMDIDTMRWWQSKIQHQLRR